MDDMIMERIVKDLETADEAGDKLASALLEVMVLMTRWKNEARSGGKVYITDAEGGIISKGVAADQILSAIEKGMRL